MRPHVPDTFTLQNQRAVRGTVENKYHIMRSFLMALRLNKTFV